MQTSTDPDPQPQLPPTEVNPFRHFHNATRTNSNECLARRHASLKVNHYPILCSKKKNSDEFAPAKWTPAESPLPESCAGGSTWVIDNMDTSVQSPSPSNMVTSSTAPGTAPAPGSDRPRQTTPPRSSRDKFFGAMSPSGPPSPSGFNGISPGTTTSTAVRSGGGFVGSRNTISWGTVTDDMRSPTDAAMLHPQHKYSLSLCPSGPPSEGGSSTSPGGGGGAGNANGTTGGGGVNERNGYQNRSPNGAHNSRLRKPLWSLSPSAFHQSFDDRNRNKITVLSNSCGNLVTEQVQNPTATVVPQHHRRRAAFCSGDTSKGAFACGYGSGNNSATGASRPPTLGGRSPQSSFDSNGDVGQISLNFMRVNGSYAPFKTLLTSTTSRDNSKEPSNHRPVGLNVACTGNGGPGSAIMTTTTATAAATPPAANLDRVNSNPIVLDQMVYNKRKESWQVNPNPCGTWRTSDIKLGDGDQQSKKSVCSAASEDLENGRADDSRTPLMKEGEKGGRLIYRQHLFHVRRITSDYALFCAILGIIVMILENELSASNVYNQNSVINVKTVLKAIILSSTFALIALVIKFHVHEVQLFMNANSAEDWRIALTFQRCFQIFLELSICAICPLPFDYYFNWTTVHADGQTVTSTAVPIDVFLSIPMFFRLYWLCRVMLLHSRLFTDASSRSIAGLNRVTFNARFILKTLMTLCPGTMLMVFTASLWILAAWILRLCERHHLDVDPIRHRLDTDKDPGYFHALKHQNYLNSLWMIAITFLSVGYGDIVPNTYCGRGVAVITGILGTCTSSMVVAVIARKLELSRAEKHVHNFMIDTQLTKQLKHSAANVLRETWLIYKNRRLVDKIDPGKIRHHQRKFLMAIYALRKVKRDQRKLAENSVSLGDVAKTTSNSYELIHDIHSIQEGLALRMTAVEHQLSDIQREIGGLAEVLRAAMGADQRRLSTDVDNNMPRDSLRRRRAAID